MERAARVQTHARLFLALSIPSTLQELLEKTLKHYTPYLERVVPASNWHITVLFLGEIADFQNLLPHLVEPLSQSFLTTISLTHVGVGQARGQLWAYANATALLTNMRSALVRRLQSLSLALPSDQNRKFIPHIKLGRLKSESHPVGIPDYPLGKTFAARELHLYRSELLPAGACYTVVGTIPLTAS